MKTILGRAIEWTFAPRRGRQAFGVAIGCLLLTLTFAAACEPQVRTSADLQALADELLPRVEALSGLEARAPIRVTLQDTGSVRAYVERQLTEELDPEELEGVHATYAALGLIPDTLDLRALMMEVYKEQIIGYYDPKAKELYVVEGVPRGEIRPVLAHELVHALQDQYADLEALIAPERGNDRQTAAQAALEGHATLVMFALMLEEQQGGAIDLRLLPDIGQQFAPVLEGQHSQFPVFRTAPRIIRETLIFPYVAGATYVQVLWNKRGPLPAGEADPARMRWPAPLDTLLPASTRQVLRPAEAFGTDRVEPVEIVLEPASGARTIYENTLGQLEISILLAEHLGEAARARAEGWLGDRFRLIEAPGGGRVLVWYSVWEGEAAADGFADAYRRILAGRSAEREGRVERVEIDGRPAVLVVDAERGVEVGEDLVPAALSLR